MSEMRLIDANAYEHPGDLIHMPTIDAVPVVHGRWEETGKVFVHSMYDLFTKCSRCSFGHVRNEYQEPYRYCPNCGAKMDGGADNG